MKLIEWPVMDNAAAVTAVLLRQVSATVASRLRSDPLLLSVENNPGYQGNLSCCHGWIICCG